MALLKKIDLKQIGLKPLVVCLIVIGNYNGFAQQSETITPDSTK